MQIDNKYIGKGSNLRRGILYLMLLLPLIIANIGFRFLANIDLTWREREQAEIARQELESLANSASFEYRFARLGGAVEQILRKSLADSAMEKMLAKASKEEFLPLTGQDFQLLVFRQSSLTQTAEIKHARSNEYFSRRVMSMVFSHMVRLHKRELNASHQSRKIDKLAQALVGNISSIDQYAVSQRGRTTFTMKNNRPHWFLWNYQELADGEVWGYFISVPVKDNHRDMARRQALKDLHKRGEGIGGFISLVEQDLKVVAARKLRESPLFMRWLERNVRPNLQNLLHWLEFGPPATETIGRYKIHSYLGRDSSHLAVFLAPVTTSIEFPVWLWLLNVLGAAIITAVFIRGALLGIWLEPGLSVRFTILYLLAASFPVGLLIIGAAGYQNQMARTERNQEIAQIEKKLRQFETSKRKMQNEYQRVARELFSDNRLREIVKEQSIHSEQIKDYILGSFATEEQNLPIQGFYLLDFNGNGTTYQAPGEESYVHDVFSVYRYTLLTILRERYIEHGDAQNLLPIKVSEDEKIGLRAYSSVSENDFVQEIRKRRNFCLSQKSGEGTATHIYDFIIIDGRITAFLFILWDGQKLLERSIIPELEKQTADGQVFVAFKNTPQGLRTIHGNQEKISGENFLACVDLAEKAVARGGLIKEFKHGQAIAAMPFGEYSEIVIVGQADGSKLARRERSRNLIFFAVIGLALLLSLISAWFTAAFLLKPVAELKTAIAKVAGGDYSVKLQTGRTDELGVLAEEFANMARGLNERQQLAALLSDHAVEALAAQGFNDKQADNGLKFSGIAMVSDIRNFTVICEKYSTSEVTEMLNQHFAIMTEIITANGGRISKFVGDAIEAVFVCESKANAAESALKAAVEMYRSMEKINHFRLNKGLFTYSGGIGLAYGDFIAGHVGSIDTRLDFCILGAALAEATRLESLTKKCHLIPVVFDKAVKEMLETGSGICEINEIAIDAFSIESYSNIDVDKYFVASSLMPDIQANVDDDSSYVKNADFNRLTAWTGFIFFFLFAAIFSLGIFWAVTSRNKEMDSYYEQLAQEKNFRLAMQLSAAESPKIAFEAFLRKMLHGIEDRLDFEYSDKERKTIREKIEEGLDTLSKLGVKTGRIGVIGLKPDDSGNQKDFIPYDILWQRTVMEHRRIFNNLVLTTARNLANGEYGPLRKEIEPLMPDLFGPGINVGHFGNEKLGQSMNVKNHNQYELMFCRQIEVLSPAVFENGLPENNYSLANLDRSKRRIAAMAMVGVDADTVRENPNLFVEGFADDNYQIALIDISGNIFSSSGFDREQLKLLSADSLHMRIGQKVLSQGEMTLGSSDYKFVIVQNIEGTGDQVNTRRLAVILIFFVLLSSFCVFQLAFSSSRFWDSISVKLGFSIAFTALVPLISVIFVANSFFYENSKAAVAQQKLEIQRYLDNYELRMYYSTPIVAQTLKEFSVDDRLQKLAVEMEKNPDSEELIEKLDAYFSECYAKVYMPGSWSSNAVLRGALVVGRGGWSYSYKHNRSESAQKSEFAETLIHLVRHIQSQISDEESGKGLEMQRVKSELFYSSLGKTVKSNFGHSAWIKLNNAFGNLVELEITTGGGGVYLLPVPSIENAQYFVIYMISLSKGYYLTRIAKHNRGPFAVFSVDYHKYGTIHSELKPLFRLDLERAASWISSSVYPVSYEYAIGSEKVSVEGRPGISQINSFMMGAASHVPISSYEQDLRYFYYMFYLLAVFVFIFLGIQTASDMLVPVRALTEGMRQIGGQNYFYRIGIDRKDELGSLCAAFDSFAKGLAEREIMSKMVSKSAKMAVYASENNSSSGSSGKRQDCILVFAGFALSSSSHTQDSENYFSELNSFVTESAKAILRFGGDIDKIMGEKILGVFPVNEDNVAEVGKDVLSCVEALIGQSDGVSAGIHIGTVICGLIGLGSKRDFTVIGDAVNTTARIQKEAESLSAQRALFSEEFVLRSAQQHKFSFYKETALKGKSEKFRLLRIS